MRNGLLSTRGVAASASKRTWHEPLYRLGVFLSIATPITGGRRCRCVRPGGGEIGGGPVGACCERALSGGPVFGRELGLVEATKILRRLERASKITPLEAASADRDHLCLDIKPHPIAPRICELRHALTSYDAWYVAVAEALNLPRVTPDRR